MRQQSPGQRLWPGLSRCLRPLSTEPAECSVPSWVQGPSEDRVADDRGDDARDDALPGDPSRRPAEQREDAREGQDSDGEPEQVLVEEDGAGPRDVVVALHLAAAGDVERVRVGRSGFRLTAVATRNL